MYCSNCGKTLDANDLYCPSCGKQITNRKTNVKISNSDFNKNFFYRLVKVLYYVSIILLSLFFIIVGWGVRPQFSSYYGEMVGSWWNTFLLWVLGIGGSYLVLNLLREMLNYIILGKPFDWEWFKKYFSQSIPVELTEEELKERELRRIKDKKKMPLLIAIIIIIAAVFIAVFISENV